MKISETKIRKIIKNQLQIKKLEALSRKIVSENQEQSELGAAGKDYKPALSGAKMPTNKTEAGNYMMKAVRQAQGITSSEVPALIQMFDDILKTFETQNVSTSKAKKLGKGAEIGKQRAGIQDS
ncbi:hypothetical protein OAA09_00645 [bacterium]|nr:hypothetical protein [bacterium]